MPSWIGESDEVFMAFSENGNQKLEPEPRKRGKSVFINLSSLIKKLPIGWF